jgi:hypothetical protein
MIKGFLERPIQTLGKKQTSRKMDVDKIDFVTHIQKMVEWLVRYTHSENMAPSLWDMTKRESRPIAGSEVVFDENIIRNLCKFYLMFHGGERPFQ